MASIEERGGRFRVKWRDPDGTIRSRTCRDAVTAKKVKEDVEQASTEGRRWRPRDVRPLPDLETVFKAFLDDQARALRSGTFIRYAQTLRVFVKWLEENKQTDRRRKVTVDFLTKDLLADFYTHLTTTGLHKKPRGKETCRKNVEVVQLAWAWACNEDRYSGLVPPPRKLRMVRGDGAPTIAPRWHEMDTCIWGTDDWYRRLTTFMRFTGLRVAQVMGLRWEDIDLEHATLRIRGELGKSRQERRGRVIPISSHLAAIVAGWGVREGWLIKSERHLGGERERMARETRVREAWVTSGVRREAWEGRPNHAFRKGFISELKRAGADSEAVEYLVGHSLGLRGVYTDADALPLRVAVDLVPPLTPEGVVLEMKRTKAEAKGAGPANAVPKASPRVPTQKENP